MNTVRREEPIIRNRFTECPHCKTRNFRIKKTIEVGRCRKCRDSYKVITLFLKVSGKTVQDEKGNGPDRELSAPSWQSPSDSSLFGPAVESHSTFSNANFAWSNEQRSDESESTSGQ